MTKQFGNLVNGVAKKLADDGKLIEAGWVGLKLAAIPGDAPQAQVDEMRLAFMAGAQHLFASIMGILDPGDEPTDADHPQDGPHRRRTGQGSWRIGREILPDQWPRMTSRKPQTPAKPTGTAA